MFLLFTTYTLRFIKLVRNTFFIFNLWHVRKCEILERIQILQFRWSEMESKRRNYWIVETKSQHFEKNKSRASDWERFLKAHSHSMSGGSIWAFLECQWCFWIAGGLVSYLTMWLLTLQLFKNSINTQEKLRLNLHSLSVSELSEYRRKFVWGRKKLERDDVISVIGRRRNIERFRFGHSQCF
jgi:hypothetical protein